MPKTVKGGASGVHASGARSVKQDVSDHLRSWTFHHRQVAVESLMTLFGIWLSSLMTWLVIGIALALPTILYLLLVNIGNVSADWRGTPRISVYLRQDVSEEAGRALTMKLGGDVDLVSARYISAEEALAEFRAGSGFGDALASLDSNPLPAVIEIVPLMDEPAQLRIILANLEGLAAVDSVSFDLAWVERLFALLSLGERFVAALGFFLALGVLLSIGNTIRLAIENRRNEIEVIKLVGGTDGFVRRPFLYLGFWYGFGGGLAAWLMVQVSLYILSGPVDRLVSSYGNQFDLSGLGYGVTLVLLSTGGLLGILGASLAVGRHLRHIEPQ